MSDPLQAVTNIPSALRPSQSVVVYVKNTLQDLISSTFNKLTGKAKSVTEEVTENTCNENEEKSESRHMQNSCEDSIICEVSPTSLSHMHRTKEAFEKRVKSFSLSLWCGKPLCLSPPILAQYGWKCIGEDVMQCCICSAVVTVRLPWPNSSNYQSVCKSAQRKIVEGHRKICSWPSNPASDAFIQPFNSAYLLNDDKEKLKLEFKERVDRLYKLQDNLPYVTSATLSDLNLGRSELSKLLKICQFTDSTDSSENETVEQMRLAAISLSLCGWDTSYTSNIQPPSIYCNDTGRVVGLWNFYSVARDNQDSSPPLVKRRKMENTVSLLSIKKSCFHPIHQHHIWSSWIITLQPFSTSLNDPTEQVVGDDLQPGWAVLRQLLLHCEGNEGSEAIVAGSSQISPNKIPSKSPLKTPPKIAVQQARKMLNEWSAI